MLVRELIGGPVDTCAAETDAVEAATQMLAADVGSLAVVTGDDLIGIVTERDLLRVLAQKPDRGGIAVRDVMTPNPDSLSPDVDVDDAAQWMMAAAGYRHLPVVEDGRLVGMVSIKDVLWAITERPVNRIEGPT